MHASSMRKGHRIQKQPSLGLGTNSLSHDGCRCRLGRRMPVVNRAVLHQGEIDVPDRCHGAAKGNPQRRREKGPGERQAEGEMMPPSDQLHACMSRLACMQAWGEQVDRLPGKEIDRGPKAPAGLHGRPKFGVYLPLCLGED